MEQDPIKKSITRRTFNAYMGILSSFAGLFGLGKAEAKDDFDKEIEQIESNNYMEVLIIPEEYRYPYTAKGREVIANHLRAGKSRYQIKQFILSKCKVIKVPIK